MIVPAPPGMRCTAPAGRPRTPGPLARAAPCPVPPAAAAPGTTTQAAGVPATLPGSSARSPEPPTRPPARSPRPQLCALGVNPLQVRGHAVLVVPADDAGRGGEHGRVGVGDRAGCAGPDEQGQIVRHVAERED